ncbi:MAG: serine/threonine-protein kinase [Nannocystaceae bacterium]|nr:serine/threonine-protein kinase [Nannocystaceae bacterium]
MAQDAASDGEAPREAAGSIEGQRVLAGVMAGLFGSEPAPVRIGRFVVLRRLGRGGMGEVYAAYDDELDRRVAIKLLHDRGEPERLRERLRREAQAIARLAHPNVVPVFEVGEAHGRVFLVMELIEGTTLRAWLAEAPRSVGEILDAFVQAGRGLIAAHAAGVVHRDLKPDNILMGRDGRVRLVDFGLSRADAGDAAAAGAAETGLAGTPRYMAPEQFEGGPIDARADQFALCVSLFEALYGTPPFAGTTPAELATHVLAGDIVAPPNRRGVSRALERVLRRGLARAPSARFDDVAALLHALAAARAAPRRVAAAAVVAGACVGAGALWLVDTRAARACVTAAEQVQAGWYELGAQASRALAAVPQSYAEHTAQRVRLSLEQYASAWAEAAVATCEAQRRDDPLAAARRSCLDERSAALEAVLAVLAEPDAQVLASATEAMLALPTIAGCNDVATLGLASPASGASEAREQVAALLPELARVDAMHLAGRWRPAQQAALALLPTVAALGHPPTHAALLRRLGSVEDDLGELLPAESHLREAYFVAGAAGLSRLAAQAAANLAVTLGVHAQRPADGAAWVEHAKMMAARVDDEELRLLIMHTDGGVRTELGELDAGVAALREALARSQVLLGAEHPRIGRDHVALGAVLMMQGAYDEAEAETQRGRESLTATLGPGHPEVAAAIHNLANLATRRGHFEQAAALHQEALALRIAALGRDNLSVAMSESGLGSALGSQGDLAAAKLHFENAIAITERVLGREHPRLAPELGNLGLVLLMQEQPEPAQALFERACALLEHGEANQTAQLAACKEQLADVLSVRGRKDESIARYREALAIRERTGGTAHPAYALAQHNLALVLADVGQDAEARTLSEAATATLERALGPEHPAVAEALRLRTKLRERAAAPDQPPH